MARSLICDSLSSRRSRECIYNFDASNRYETALGIVRQREDARGPNRANRASVKRVIAIHGNT